jgi:Peptidase S46
MRQPCPLEAIFAVLVLLLAASAGTRAEEGVWTFDNFPIARVNQTLGTRIDQAWLDRVRLSSVRFGGCSAGIVSADGLVMTNNHCVATCVANLSTVTVNYANTGFTPRRREDERTCPGGLAEVLLSIADVTGRMQAAGGSVRTGVHRGSRRRGGPDRE